MTRQVVGWVYSRIAPPNVYETCKLYIGLDIVKCDTVIGGVRFMHRMQSRKGHGRGPGRQRGAGSKKRQKIEWMSKWQHHGDDGGAELQNGGVRQFTDSWDGDDSWGEWRYLDQVNVCRWGV